MNQIDDMIHELAIGLKETISEADLAYLKRDPEEAFADLACKLILRIRGKLTIIPSLHPEEHARMACAEAALRTFAILTRWLREHPECSCVTEISQGRFRVATTTSDGTKLFCGEDVQDAYAQVAQTIACNEGTL